MRVICFLLLMVLTGAGQALAQDGASPTVNVINIAPDKPEILKINQEASSVIVGNPKYASVTMDNPTTLLIIPRAEGTTSLTVLNKKGEIVMERRLVIGGHGDKYVRIRRACTPNMKGCVPSSTYYCPDGCSEISLGNSAASENTESGDAGNNGIPVVIPMNTPPDLPADIQPIDESQLETPQ